MKALRCLTMLTALSVTPHCLFAQTFTDINAGLTGVSEGSAAWGDYDNDGDLDLVETGLTEGGAVIAKIYRNDDNGTFTDIGASLTGVRRSSAAWGDYDNDGDLDLVLSGTTSPGSIMPDTTIIYRNDNGNFVGIGTSIVNVTEGSTSWADYDNDGDLDLLVAGSVDGLNNTAKLYRNDGAGQFTDIQASLSPTGNAAAAWGDYDNDGDLDILLSGNNGFSFFTKIYRNDGNGTFLDIGASFTGVMLGSVAWGDYDQDGDLDVLLTGSLNGGGSSVISKVYRNDGSGVFTDIGASLTGVYVSSAVWGDCDNDGDLDILLSGNTDGGTGRITKIYRNDGSGIFTDINAALTASYWSSAAWGDHDNDGDLDILQTGHIVTNYIAKIYRNEGSVFNTAPSAPSNLSSLVSANSATLSWNKATDSETAQNSLTYNLRIGTTPGGSQTLSPMASSGGYRKLSKMGNAGLKNGWTVKNLPGGTYYWSVQTIDNVFAGSAFATEESFSIAGVNVTAPNTAQILIGSSSYSITWSSLNLTGTVDILLSTDGGSSFNTTISTNETNDSSYQWSVPNISTSQGRILIRSSTNPSIRDSSDENFSIVDQTSPILGVPSFQTSVTQNSSVNVSVSATDNYAVSGVALYYKSGSAINYTNLAMTSAGGSVYGVNIPAVAITENGVSFFVQAIDNSSNVTYSDTFSIAVIFASLTSSQLANSEYPSGLPDGKWRLISVPGNLNNKMIKNVFPNIGNPGNDRWLAFDENTHDISDSASVTGKGFWFKEVLGGNPITISTGAGNSFGDDGIDVILDPGWNIIGNPFAFPIPISFNQTQFYGPVKYGADDQGIEGWSAVLDTLNPFGGYAVNNKTGVNKTIRIKPDGTSVLNKTRMAAQSDIFIQLKAVSQNKNISYGDLFNFIGAGHDRSITGLNAPEPMYLDDFVSLYFSDEKNTNEFKVLNEDGNIWDMNIQTSFDNAKVDLSAVIQKLPETMALKIYDLARNEIVPASQDLRYRFNQKFKGTSKFKIIVGKPDFVEKTVNDIGARLPKEFMLSQNYPNPFNPTTVIRYQLPVTSRVLLKIYNMLGEEIATLVNNELLSSGQHNVSWNGKNQNGNPAASGVYVYQLQAEGVNGRKSVNARKMLLIK